MKGISGIQKMRLLRKIPGKKDIFDIPFIHNDPIDLQFIKLINFKNTRHGDSANIQKIIHFFLFDYVFDYIFDYPDRHLDKFSEFKAVLSPDFSTYADMDKAMIISSIYRNRWLGAYWQSKGVKVIPTIGWASPDTYDICFAGVEKGCSVAVSTLGANEYQESFLNGYHEMQRRLDPNLIICLGPEIQGMTGNVIYIKYVDSFGRGGTNGRQISFSI
jgi:hypothetical protein